jgi:hypothetical protein
MRKTERQRQGTARAKNQIPRENISFYMKPCSFSLSMVWFDGGEARCRCHSIIYDE